ncbi:MAG: hypothetical protein RLZZ159_1238 [Actinomycetota bacterium]|jgi:tight adherence protein B
MQPTLVGFVSSTLCALGYLAFTKGLLQLPLSDWRQTFQLVTSSKNSKWSTKEVLVVTVTTISVYMLILVLTESPSISMAISTLATSIPFLINKQRAESLQRVREAAWPEAIDSLVSALQSGISITDAVLSLSDHGPYLLRPSFLRIKREIILGETFEAAITREKEFLKSSISDQVFQTLLVAKEFGGRDSNSALRLLSEFIRDDIEVIEEIRTKFGWIRNSAALASAAPWLLLVLLSSQKTTVEAFSTSAGKGILITGVMMTAIAYLWMERVGHLPEPARALR